MKSVCDSEVSPWNNQVGLPVDISVESNSVQTNWHKLNSEGLSQDCLVRMLLAPDLALPLLNLRLVSLVP